MRISDWSSDVCSSDLQDLLLDVLRRIGGDDAILHTHRAHHSHGRHVADLRDLLEHDRAIEHRQAEAAVFLGHAHSEHAEIGEVLDVLPREDAILVLHHRSEEHTSELQSLMSTPYAVFCLTKKNK